MTCQLVSAITAHAKTRPDARAVFDSRDSLTYKNLDGFSTRICNLLKLMGCKPGDRVVLIAHPSVSSISVVIGIFKAGAVLVPLDPRTPRIRLRYILRDIAPLLLIAAEPLVSELRKALGSPPALLSLSSIEALLLERVPNNSGLDCNSENNPLSPDALAYCIYTSGSTGHPKGVLIEHRSIDAFLEGARELYDVTSESACASFSPLHFDAFLFDTVLPLVRGASLYVHDDVVAPDVIVDILLSYQITHFAAWGVMLGLITRAENFHSVSLPHLRTVLTGADVPDLKAVQSWLRKNPHVRVINGYGPTEATCAATAHVINQVETDRREPYPIGRPLRHAKVFLVDGQDRVIDEPGLSGELVIGGLQVMREYWGLPNETEAAMFQLCGLRCYRTGDLCCYLSDGNLLFIGRKDSEVNLGGYRVHLNEIRRVIGSDPSVSGTEIMQVDSRFGEKLLAAAILIVDDSGTEDTQHLARIRRLLMLELPAYMVPRYLEIFDAFPTLSSGKPDRKQIAAIISMRANGHIHEATDQ